MARRIRPALDAMQIGLQLATASLQTRDSIQQALIFVQRGLAAARGSAQPSALRLYQGLVRAFQRRGKAYELRCGQLYGRTIAAFADRGYAFGAREIRHLAETCLAP